MVHIPLPRQSRLIKKVLPRSLFGRTLLIILIPLAVTIAVAFQVFYGSHLDIVSAASPPPWRARSRRRSS